jgi:hypothetical protein
VEVLLEARLHIKRVFGGAEVSLEVEDDPEGDFEELFCVIALRVGPENALSLLRRFDDEWFGEAGKLTNSLLNFTVETIDAEEV